MILSRALGMPICLLACLAGGGRVAHAGGVEERFSIAICDDGNEWPPYSYYARVEGKKTRQLAGYAVDVIDEIFARHKVRYSIDLIPWTRCQAVAIIGKEYGMVLNMTYNARRARSFYLSRPYYFANTYYFYSRRNHPDGLSIRSPADLGNYRVCGVQGYNYEGLGIDAEQIDQGAKDFVALVAKLEIGRCSLFLEKDQVMAGFAGIGKDYLSGHDIGKAPLPGVKPTAFHFGVSKRHPQGATLRKVIDDDLRRMEASGRLEELLKKSTAQLAQP